MGTYTLGEIVYPGDLIFTYGPDKAHMLLVKSAPGSNDTNPSASSIVVEEVIWQIPDQKGSWAMSGPAVYYVEEEEADHSDHLNPETTLDHLLDSWGLTDAIENGRHQDVGVIVNPHGRDILKYYCGGVCPNCEGLGWICPGCGGVSTQYPELFGSCGVDLSCPVCMGYDFALDDKSRLDELDPLKSRLYSHKSDVENSSLSGAELQELKEEALSEIRERYELINSRQEEMGLHPEDVDKLVQQFQEVYF